MPLPHGSQAPPALWRWDSAQPWGSQSPMVGDWGGTGCASCVRCRRGVCVWGQAALGPVPCCVKPVFLILY